MKIEKVNDNQIKCTLTREDLDKRHIKLSELAYGTEKAKLLFQDMMQQAFSEFGFEAEDIPLMIEAIPVSKDTVVLIVTKVADPEELDTRFSRFAPYLKQDTDEIPGIEEALERADEILEMFRKKTEEVHTGGSTDTPVSPRSEGELIRLFHFTDLDHVIDVSHVLAAFFDGPSTLFKNPANSSYYLKISRGKAAPEDFNKACNILSEYGTSVKQQIYSPEYLEEHFNIMIASDAIPKLSTV